MLEIVESNDEGTLVDTFPADIDSADGALINPAGLTRHGV